MVEHPAERSAARGFVLLTLEFHKEGRLWAGECRELGVAAGGRSLEKLAAHLAGLVELHLDGLEQAGERENVFREHGVTLYTDDLPESERPSVPLREAAAAPFIRFQRIWVGAAAHSAVVGRG